MKRMKAPVVLDPVIRCQVLLPVTQGVPLPCVAQVPALAVVRLWVAGSSLPCCPGRQSTRQNRLAAWFLPCGSWPWMPCHTLGEPGPWPGPQRRPGLQTKSETTSQCLWGKVAPPLESPWRPGG